jgi:hypothetical protein
MTLDDLPEYARLPIARLIARSRPAGVVTIDEIDRALPQRILPATEVENIFNFITESGVQIAEAG